MAESLSTLAPLVRAARVARAQERRERQERWFMNFLPLCHHLLLHRKGQKSNGVSEQSWVNYYGVHVWGRSCFDENSVKDARLLEMVWLILWRVFHHFTTNINTVQTTRSCLKEIGGWEISNEWALQRHEKIHAYDGWQGNEDDHPGQSITFREALRMLQRERIAYSRIVSIHTYLSDILSYIVMCLRFLLKILRAFNFHLLSWAQVYWCCMSSVSVKRGGAMTQAFHEVPRLEVHGALPVFIYICCYLISTILSLH